MPIAATENTYNVRRVRPSLPRPGEHRADVWSSAHRTSLREGLAVAALLLIFLLQLVHVARVYSANWDEAHHVYDGYRIWTQGDFRLNAEVPPLVKLTAALPLRAMNLQLPPEQHHSQALDAFEQGRLFVFGNGGDRVLFPARMACMLFTLLTAGLLYAAAREMFGLTAALAALGLFVFDPTVLAHGTLVSTDLGSACLIFACVYAFYRYGEAPSLPRLALAGVLAGLAAGAKFTGIFVFPMLVLLACAESLLARSAAVLLRRLTACAAILVCAWVVIWALYGFRYAAAPGGKQLSPPLAPYVASLPSRSNAAELAVIARLHLLPEPYIWGLANTKKTEWEYTSYFFGRMYRHGPWQYFPTALLIKATVPLLILLALLPFLWFRGPHRHTRELCFLLIPVGFYLALVSSSHMDIGARYLSDSNVDWGQQLKAVHQYLSTNHIDQCWFAYFADGAVQPADYGIPCRRLPTGSSLWWFQLPMDVPPVLEGTVLISDSDLEGVESGDGPLNWFAPFRDLKPVATIQHGVYVYQGRFAVPLMAALVDVRRTGELLKAGESAQALAMAEQAVELAPGSATTQMNLADRLAAQAQWSGALQHYEIANHLAQTVRPELQGDDLGASSMAGIEKARNQLSGR